MSKNCQNNEYYEIGIFSIPQKRIVKEYVTELPIVKDVTIHTLLMKFLYQENPGDIMVLFNKRSGKLPNDDRDVIKINIPSKPVFKYNR